MGSSVLCRFSPTNYVRIIVEATGGPYLDRPDRSYLSIVGAIASHGDFPIERIKLDRNGKFLGSVSHDDCLKLTDVSEILEDSDDEEVEGEGNVIDEDDDAESVGTVKGEQPKAPASVSDSDGEDGDSGDSDDSDAEEDEHGSTAMETSDDDEDRAERRREKRRDKERLKKAEKRSKTGLVKTKEQEEAEKADKGFFDDL